MSLSPSLPREITTVLVANRGEIARRIIRTVHQMGLRAVAVYSDADAGAAHVREADEAVRLGPAPASDSYLDIDAVVSAAVATGAEAVHPGYGFLSENARFGAALERAGIAFIGPAAHALGIMGDKITAKNHVSQAGVPVTPGVAEPGLSDEELIRRAQDVGFPLLIKPSAGGGGQGMVEVHAAEDLPGALASARRTARNAFGDDTLFLERLVPRPRHIEVQILADAHGNVVHLGERECSLQRRHQKVIEEAPAPLMESMGEQGVRLRERLGAAAVAAAASVEYVGAGTVEFLASGEDPEDVFFMEMNTRLQVEHPVTEEVVRVRGERIDLVEWQVRIAAGEPLDFSQADVTLDGHAVEARVYAERPENDFLPAVGPVHAVRFPAGTGIRIDAALDGPGEISAHYDPMIAKVIAWGPDRARALARLDRALAGTFIAGGGTNLTFLRRLLANDDVRRGTLDVDLIGRTPALTEALPVPPEAARLMAAAAVVREAGAQHDGAQHDGARPPMSDAWATDGFRAGGLEPVGVDVVLEGDGHVPDAGDAEWRARVTPVAALGSGGVDAGGAWVQLDGMDAEPVRITAADLDRDDTVLAHAADGPPEVWVRHGGITSHAHALGREDLLRRALAGLEPGSAAGPAAQAPMTGTVVAVAVEDGATVTAGQVLVSIEAMKMEHAVLAPHDGTVRIGVATGDQVTQGQTVATVEPQPQDPGESAPQDTHLTQDNPEAAEHAATTGEQAP